MQKIMANDVKLINAIKDDKREIEVHKATLEVQERKRTSLQQEQAALRDPRR
jgi:peptidoglycan hydrolase CwlO-like protein